MSKLNEITGKALSGEWGADDETGKGIPVLRTTNFTNDGVVDYNNVITRTITKKNIAEKYLRPGDIIIEKSGGSDKQPVGRVVYFDRQENTYLFNNFTGLLRVKNQKKWLPKYVFYSLYENYRKGGTRAFENKTTGLHNLKLDAYVSKYEIAEINYDEQIEVCNKLDRVYRIIKMREREIKKFDNLIKARFVEMFGDPELNEKKWNIEKLEKLCLVGSSKRIYQNEQSTKGVPFLRISDLINRMDTGKNACDLCIPEERFLELKEQGLVPQTGDILLTARGTLGRCYIIKSDDKFYFQDGMITWLSNFDDRVTSLYISFLFSITGFRKQIDALQAGSTVAYLSIAMTKKLDVMIPPIELQNQFAAFVVQIDKSKAVVQRALDETQLLFDSLMQEYFG
jgi:type I restriction enzyme S subunit